jgi:hypothetical protein
MAFEWCTAVDGKNRGNGVTMLNIWPGAFGNGARLPEMDRNEMLLGGKMRLPHGRPPSPMRITALFPKQHV